MDTTTATTTTATTTTTTPTVRWADMNPPADDNSNWAEVAGLPANQEPPAESEALTALFEATEVTLPEYKAPGEPRDDGPKKVTVQLPQKTDPAVLSNAHKAALLIIKSLNSDLPRVQRLATLLVNLSKALKSLCTFDCKHGSGCHVPKCGHAHTFLTKDVLKTIKEANAGDDKVRMVFDGLIRGIENAKRSLCEAAQRAQKTGYVPEFAAFQKQIDWCNRLLLGLRKDFLSLEEMRPLCPTWTRTGMCGDDCNLGHPAPKRNLGEKAEYFLPLCTHYLLGKCAAGNCKDGHPTCMEGVQTLDKTKMCTTIQSGRNCRYGKKCHFAHSEAEIVKLPCRFGAACRTKGCNASHEPIKCKDKDCEYHNH